ncbi:MAG: hypothetical protein SFV32_13160 [Opitutaceae bacterium]|nr:hypothetical protein [Opitutaceae bacterium]
MKSLIASLLLVFFAARLAAATITFTGEVTLSTDPLATGVVAGQTATASYTTGELQSKDILPGGLEFWRYESTLDLQLGAFELLDQTVLVTLFTSPFGTFFNAGFYPDLVVGGLASNHIAFSGVASALVDGMLPTTFPMNGFITSDLAFNNFNLAGFPLIVASFTSVQVSVGSVNVDDESNTMLLLVPAIFALLRWVRPRSKAA